MFTSCDKDDDKSGSNGGGSSKLPEYAELNGVKYFKFPPMDLYGLNNEICMMEIDEKYPEYVYDSYMGSAAVYEAICKENRNLFYFTNDGYEMSKIESRYQQVSLPLQIWLKFCIMPESSRTEKVQMAV